MAAITTLVTPKQVSVNSPVNCTFPVDWFCERIYFIEYKIFKDCLGIDFYDVLISFRQYHLDAVEYDDTATYNLDDKVFYDGIVYKSLIANNTDVLSNTSSWGVQTTFTDSGYQSLWDMFMLSWISWNIQLRTITYVNYQAGAKGITKYSPSDETGQGTVAIKEFQLWKEQLNEDISDLFSMMTDWIKDQVKDTDVTTDYSKITWISNDGDCAVADDCAEISKRSNQRIAFPDV